MNEINQNLNDTSIWRTTKGGNWQIFYEVDKKGDSALSEVYLKNFQENTSGSTFKMGGLVMTPNGIGRLIKLEESIATVKFLKTEEEINYPEKEILSEFPIFLRVIGSDCNNWLKVFVPSNGSVEQLKKTLEENNVIDLSSNFLLIHEGQEIRDDFFFDQMDMKKNSKILLAKLKMTPCKINRFPTTSNQWWYISTNMDGITFSVNKKIKLTGFGIFRSHENKTFGANIKVIEGTPTSMGNCLVEETIEIPTAPDALNNITPFNFKRPVTIKANTQYTAQLSIVSSQNNYAYTYYGSSGTATVEGEKKAEFTFTYCSGYSTSIESGLFPEFYYLC